MGKPKLYCIGSVCKPLSVWGKLFDISAPLLRHRLNKGLSLIEAICFKKQIHGLIGSKEYQAWNTIKERCLNPKSKRFKDYGAKGITICDEWKDNVQAFYDHVGKAPEGKRVSLDRIDNDRGYEPGNVRWVVNQSIQTINRGLFKKNKSGVAGVRWNNLTKRWLAQINVNKKLVYLGSFSNKDDAIKVRKDAEEKYYAPLLR